MYYFIVNTSGASGRAVRTWKKVSHCLQKRGIAYKALFTQGKGHGAVLAQEVCAQYAPCTLCVVGGDGTINEVLNGLFSYKCPNGKTGLSLVRFALIPTGSGNDFARGAKIPKNIKKALSLFTENPAEVALDLGLVRFADGTERVFGISAGLGMDAIVCREASTSRLKKILNALHLGSLVYIFLTVKTLFSMKTSAVSVKSGNEYYTFDRLIFLSAMNFSKEGGGVAVFPRASAVDANLSFCLASNISKLKAFLDLPFLVLALHEKLKGFRLWSSSCIEVKATPPLVLHTDGEYAGTVGEVKIECLPATLCLLGHI